MKNLNPFTLLCGTIALLCLFSMFVPVVAPHYSAELYQPGSDNYAKDYYLSGDYYQSREYWSIATFALTDASSFHRIAVMISMALVLYWCTMSFMGEKAVWTGLIASVGNLVVVLCSVVKMLSMAGGTRPLVIVIVILDSVVAVVCALMQGLPERRRYTKPMRIGKKG